MARTLHEAFKAISLVSNPLFSKVSIKIYYIVSSYSAIVVANIKAVNSSELKRGRKRSLLILPLTSTSLV